MKRKKKKEEKTDIEKGDENMGMSRIRKASKN